MQTRWTDRYAQRTQTMHAGVVRELLKLTAQPEVISFAGGLPGADLFPIDRFQDACRRVLSEHGPQALQYSTTEGERPLREMIARHTSRYGIVVGPDNVLITSGSQQALDLIGKVFLNPGDHVLVEHPTYLGALQAWNAYQAEYLTVAMDDHGMRPRELEAALRSGPKFIYALPNFQNPTGVTLSLERRRALIRLADQHGVPVLEDDPYGQLRYEGDHLPSLVTLDAEYRGLDRSVYGGNVLYMSTFSKTLAPGHRSDRCHSTADARQAGRRSAHEHVRAERRVRSRALRVPRPPCSKAAQRLRRAPRRHALGHVGHVSARRQVDEARRRVVHLGIAP
jgi:2-aminoadipate transaminase